MVPVRFSEGAKENWEQLPPSPHNTANYFYTVIPKSTSFYNFYIYENLTKTGAIYQKERLFETVHRSERERSTVRRRAI